MLRLHSHRPVPVLWKNLTAAQTQFQFVISIIDVVGLKTLRASLICSTHSCSVTVYFRCHVTHIRRTFPFTSSLILQDQWVSLPHFKSLRTSNNRAKFGSEWGAWNCFPHQRQKQILLTIYSGKCYVQLLFKIITFGVENIKLT